MKKFYCLIIILLIVSNVSAQTIQIPYGTAVIDGVVDAAWDVATPNPITRNFRLEKPTVDGSTWQAMYDDNFFYVLVNVIDQGNHYPGWESGGNNWEYDKPEVYWDWNDILKDGGGPGVAPNNLGHWQLADGFTEGMYGNPITKAGNETLYPGGTYCYTLNGQNYVYEMKVPFANFKDKNNVVITKEIAIAKAAIGFDVTIIDQDQGITTVRQRTAWMNDGAVDENWNNMDGAGTICLKNSILNVSPSITNISGSNGSTSQITIQSNTNWTASSNQSWLSINQTSGNSNGTITISATKNSQILPRTAIVTINAGAISRIVNVTQNIEVEIPYGTAVIDGVIDAGWDVATPNPITRNHRLEKPTVDGSTWQAMYDDNFFYVLVNVIDQGNHYPGWESGGNNWEYDKPEVYWDWNTNLKDGVGVVTNHSGHYQLADGFLQNSYGIPITKVPSEQGDRNPGGTYCYKLSGENYVYEMAVPFTNFYDKDGLQITSSIAKAKTSIGFDVTIIDRDQDITTVRHRKNWANDGAVDENWNNMDDMGTLKLKQNTLEISSSSMSVSSNEGSNGSINITSNATWTASSNQTWLTLNPLSKTGNGALTFTATANPTISVRIATVTITVPGTTSKTLTVTQEAGPATLSVLPTSLNIGSNAGSTAAFNVTSNTAWSVSSDQTWLTVSTSTGTGNGTVTLTAESNLSIVSRTATVTISAEGVNSQTVTVMQIVGAATLSVLPTSLNIGSTAGSTATFNVASNAAWSASSDQMWLVVNPSTGTGNGTVTLTADVNPKIVSRVATVTISATGTTSQTVTITQAAGAVNLSVSTSTLSIASAGSSTSTFEIVSNTLWTVSSNKSWLTINPSAGSGNSTITVTAEENSSVTERIANITVAAVGAASQVITVTQLNGTATLSVSPSTLNIASVNNSTTSFNVNSNISWSVSSDQTWLTAIPATGSNNGTVTIIAEANSTVTERIAIITISADGVSPQTVTITQAKGEAILSVTDETIDIKAAQGSTTTVQVTSNITWIASSDQSWLTVSPNTSVNGDGTLILTAAANTGASRNAIVTLISIIGVKTITVTQAAGPNSVRSIASDAIKIYPNPVNNGFRIDGLTGDSDITLTNLDGRILFSKKISENEFVQSAFLNKGVYLIRIHSIDGVIIKKLIVE